MYLIKGKERKGKKNLTDFYQKQNVSCQRDFILPQIN